MLGWAERECTVRTGASWRRKMGVLAEVLLVVLRSLGFNLIARQVINEFSVEDCHNQFYVQKDGTVIYPVTQTNKVGPLL